jgi:hypothetical protein
MWVVAKPDHRGIGDHRGCVIPVEQSGDLGDQGIAFNSVTPLSTVQFKARAGLVGPMKASGRCSVTMFAISQHHPMPVPVLRPMQVAGDYEASAPETVKRLHPGPQPRCVRSRSGVPDGGLVDSAAPRVGERARATA